jgi:hypothetical protein
VIRAANVPIQITVKHERTARGASPGGWYKKVVQAKAAFAFPVICSVPISAVISIRVFVKMAEGVSQTERATDVQKSITFPGFIAGEQWVTTAIKAVTLGCSDVEVATQNNRLAKAKLKILAV